jgi:hypothetical protein
MTSADEQTVLDRKDVRSLRWLRLLTVVMVGVGVLVAISASYLVLRPPRFAPLVFTTTVIQQVSENGVVVVPQVTGVDAPSVYVDDEVPMVFSFCSDATENFEAVGNSWFVEAGTGKRYPLNIGIRSTIRPGCVSPRTSVDIPVQVSVKVRDLPNPDRTTVPRITSWYIEGELTPDRSGGVSAKWQTETFLIVAERRPGG